LKEKDPTISRILVLWEEFERLCTDKVDRKEKIRSWILSLQKEESPILRRFSQRMEVVAV
jgi:hypothetical protein